MDPSDVVLRFLASVGRPGEVELYVDLFRAQRAESFAILAVAGEVDEEAFELDLHYLERLDLQNSPQMAQQFATWSWGSRLRAAKTRRSPIANHMPQHLTIATSRAVEHIWTFARTFHGRVPLARPKNRERLRGHRVLKQSAWTHTNSE